MRELEPLGLHANSWQFLDDVESYVAASQSSARPLASASTRRQFLTARDILSRLNGSRGTEARKGILLADDVGLGKTTIAAMVAWVVARSRETAKVRVLAPNEVLRRRWEEELLAHVPLLSRCAGHLGAEAKHVRGEVERLRDGSIQVATHHYASTESKLTCDLLIVDEAHRAKGDGTYFSEALKRQRQATKRILILTATPFSIAIKELERMLLLIDAHEAVKPVRQYDACLRSLHGADTNRSIERMAERLADKAAAATAALGPVLVRHSVEDLPEEERQVFGAWAPWQIEVPHASDEEVEIMVRTDRLLRLTGPHRDGRVQTNDPRFHVGWRHLDRELDDVSTWLKSTQSEIAQVARDQLKSIQALRKRVGPHSKMDAVARAISARASDGEKVLVFCHHRATAHELTLALADMLGSRVRADGSPSVWRQAWDEVLEHDKADPNGELRAAFLEWLCSDGIRAQVHSWLPGPASDPKALAASLRRTRARPLGPPIATAASLLLHTLTEPGSHSTRGAMRSAARDGAIGRVPGAARSRVIAAHDPTEELAERDAHLFLGSKQPDTIIAIFNSPFGPDVLVATDRMSEGIDLHRHCRCLVHYELDASPIRTVQRNGRLRRVNSWAAVTKRPIECAFPAFRGTRDHRLVEIMKKRIESFSLLLGGVLEVNIEETSDGDEDWRQAVIAAAKAKLRSSTQSLTARPPS